MLLLRRSEHPGEVCPAGWRPGLVL
ncbi:MAG: hypothetical protein IPN59_13260 [Holophaga sp.]|nr:hypothetical protein [Holophaga sp.]